MISTSVSLSPGWIYTYNVEELAFFEFHYTVAFNVGKMQARIYSINKGGNAKYV